MKRFFAMRVALAAIVFGVPLLISPAAADVFGSGANSFQIEFVTIGQPGNPPDENPNPAGAVPYEYRIAKYEVSEAMIDAANALGGLGITHDGRGPNFPATSLSWYEAARLVNWLNASSGHTPAYKFDAGGNFQLWELDDPGYDPGNLYRNNLAKYFLPSLNEWHKAAYYDPVAGHYWDYPTGSDSIPDGIDFVGDSNFDAVFFDGAANPDPNDIMNVGLLSPYGTAGQGGNVHEWHETAFDRINNFPEEQRSSQGGAWTSTHNVLNATNTGIGTTTQFEGSPLGFRVVGVIPEPNAFLLFSLGILEMLVVRIRKRASCPSPARSSINFNNVVIAAGHSSR